MLLLNVSIGLRQFNFLGVGSCPQENKPLAQMGYFYGSIYRFLERVAKEIISDMQREEKSKEISQDVLTWHSANLVSSQSKPGVRYSVSATKCSCPDHVYRHADCKHMRMFRERAKSLPACNQPAINLSERERLDMEAMQAREDLLGF